MVLTFIEYSTDIYDIYENSNKYNPHKKRKTLLNSNRNIYQKQESKFISLSHNLILQYQ